MKMKLKLLLVNVFLFVAFAAMSQNIGIGTITPDSSAQLDVYSINKGFLPPRVALTSREITLPVNNPKEGLLVYNTSTSGSTPNNVAPGYYYWNGSNWYPVTNKANTYGDMQFWNGSNWVNIPLGINGQVLTICNGKPFWGNGTCQTLLILQPENNLYELNYNSYSPNQLAGVGTQMAMQAWTANGNYLFSREILKFDFSTIPNTATIDSAKLFLYAAANPAGGNTIDAHSGSSNSLLIQRISSTWNLPCPYSWNNPPNITVANQSLIPQSSYAFEDNTIDVKSLVSDMLTNGNNGFLIRLQNEVTYNIRQYTASFNTNAVKRPKLLVYYH